MQLNDLLAGQGIDPKGVLVMRHRPFEREFRKVLPWLAAEQPEAYNAYQQAQGPTVEKAMTKADYVASFIGHAAGKALFIGLYRRGDWRPLDYAQYWRLQAIKDMAALGMRGFEGDRPHVLWFDLAPTDFYADWKGRLVVQWPGLERSWWRWAARNEILIDAIPEQSLLDAAMPTWDELVLDWDELKVLPSKWQAALAEWRGIYFILDRSDGKGYVGAAYGDDNILGRWWNYAASGHGGNKALKQRDPQYFRFSILERVSPDMSSDHVIRLEATWKDRLHTREHGLNEN